MLGGPWSGRLVASSTGLRDFCMEKVWSPMVVPSSGCRFQPFHYLDAIFMFQQHLLHFNHFIPYFHYYLHFLFVFFYTFTTLEKKGLCYVLCCI